MPATSRAAHRFGDLLALARHGWIAQLSADLAAAGHPGYRRTDAAAVRLLRRGAMPVGRLADALGVTRQAARKVVAGLEQRGLATARRNAQDTRQVDVALTPAGAAYAAAITDAIDALERSLAGRVDAADLAAADRVLRAVVAGSPAAALAARLLAPGPR